MPVYVVTRNIPRPSQISIEDILNDLECQDVKARHITKGGTVTRVVDSLRPDIIDRLNVPRLIAVLKQFNKSHDRLFEADRKSLYREFYLPKKSGHGLRRIDAPNDELMAALRELKTILETDFNALYHTAAYAYIQKRSTIDAVKRHQANESRWFLKTDFSDFFGSTTEEFLMRMLAMICPFSEVMKSDEGKAELSRAISLAFLNGGLPQGTPISPSLTNILMIPIDHRLANYFAQKQMVYTRYADDILISSKVDFRYRETVDFINHVVRDEFHAPYVIKPEKTRYGSRAGRNWNLGVMLNDNNEITIGHKRKKEFKAMINNYLTDIQAGIQWDLHDVQVFRGLISYYEMVEKDTIHHIIETYNEKFGVNLRKVIVDDLSGRYNGQQYNS